MGLSKVLVHVELAGDNVAPITLEVLAKAREIG